MCDTGAFWQTSYLNVIHPSQWPDAPVCTQEEYDIVAAGKADRGAVVEYGETGFLAEMAQYNAMENDILARVTERLNIGFMNKDIPIKLDRAEWYGPGRAAQLWMDMLSKKLPEKQTIAQKDVYERVYPPVIEAAQATYYGGWFEQMAHGRVGDVWEYDINSAYPYIISRLPCLHHGVWTHGSTGTELFETYGDSAYTLVRASVKGSNPYIGCMPHRRLKGAICRPHNTAGWFWWHELIAATHAGVIDHVDVEEFWNYAPCDCPPPFNPVDIGIERMYRLRLQAGKNGPQGKAFKLVYNSSYGKTAQSVGSPKYSNPLYASLITAGTRAMILDAIATHPEGARAVTMVATDGIYFTSRHPNLNLNKTELGAWDETFKPNLTQMMPGVYWDDKTREGLARGEHPKLKSRGVSAKVIGAKISEIDALWQEMKDNVSAGNPFEWPAITLQVPVLMTSAKLALHQGRWERAGAVQQGAERRISANPHDKRDTNSVRLEDDILRTNPCVPEYIESVPYSRDFGYSDFADPMDDGYYQPNGDGVWADLQHFLGGGIEA